MRNKRKVFIIAGALLILIVGGYYTYRKDQKIRNNGVYSIATIEKMHPARNGWRVWYSFSIKNEVYSLNGIKDWKRFANKDIGKRYFIKCLPDNPESITFLVSILQVPDSIQYAPPEGWSEKWMKEHFPQVVEYVHDTR